MFADRFDLGGDGNTTKPVLRDVHLNRRIVYATVALGNCEVQATRSPADPSLIQASATCAENPVVVLTLSASDRLSAPARKIW